MAGDRDAEFEELYKYYPAVVAFLRRFGFSSDEARDLAQGVFVRVYQRMDSYRGLSHWSYLQQVTRTVALNEIRDRRTLKRGAVLVSEENLSSLIDDRVAAPDQAVAKKLDTDRLRRTVDRLDHNLRVCILLYLAGFSYLEIGAILGISQAAVKSRLNDARARLRLLMETEPQKPDEER